MNDMPSVIAKLMRTFVRPLGPDNPTHTQRPAAKPPAVKDMNPRQLAAHRKRQRRIARNKALQED